MKIKNNSKALKKAIWDLEQAKYYYEVGMEYVAIDYIFGALRYAGIDIGDDEQQAVNIYILAGRVGKAKILDLICGEG